MRDFPCFWFSVYYFSRLEIVYLNNTVLLICQLFAYDARDLRSQRKFQFIILNNFFPILHRVSQCQQLLMSLETDGLWEDC